MAGQWYVSQSGEDRGPYTLEELTALVQKGELTPDDSLRKEGSNLYIGASRLKGLFPVVAAQPTDSSDAPPDPRAAADHRQLTAAARSSGDPESWMSRFSTSLLLMGGAAALIVGIGLALWIESAWRMRESRRFPVRADLSRAAPVSEMVKARLDMLRPPRPEKPSISGLEIGVPVAIPGLDGVSEGFSPTLSDNMKRIVFAALSTGGYDLFEARRSEITKPFEAPKQITSCTTPEVEAYPSLSQDGLKLLFLRSDSTPKLMLSQRASLSEEFDAPVEIAVEGLDPVPERIGYPQFYGMVRAVIFAWHGTSSPPQFHLAEISSSSNAWTVAEELPFPNSYPPYRLCNNGLRAYYGWKEGLWFVVRKRVTDDFSLEIEMLPSTDTGPIDGPVWISPQEDVAFYCSPGPGRELGQGRSLWMVRF